MKINLPFNLPFLFRVNGGTLGYGEITYQVSIISLLFTICVWMLFYIILCYIIVQYIYIIFYIISQVFNNNFIYSYLKLFKGACSLTGDLVILSKFSALTSQTHQPSLQWDSIRNKIKLISSLNGTQDLQTSNSLI